MFRQAQHERNQCIPVRPELVEGLNQSFLSSVRVDASTNSALKASRNMNGATRFERIYPSTSSRRTESTGYDLGTVI